MKKIIQKITKKIEEFFGYTIVNIKAQNQEIEKRISKENFFDLYFSMIDPANFFFLQIGANDGITNDPIYSYVTQYKLPGLVVEPQPDVFKLLQSTYRLYPMVTCANLAVGNESKTLPFFSVKDSYKTSTNFKRVTGLATFNKEVIQKTIKRKIPPGSKSDDYIQETQVKALSLTDLVNEYKINKIDLIQIDCEGYDNEILKMIDFDQFEPRIINFESIHLSDRDRIECENLLEVHGYKWFRHGIDTCAYKF